MLIAGLWHGAGWTFILWGGLHGGALVVNHLWKRKKLAMPRWLAWLVTFLFINVTFVLFRAKNLAEAGKVLKGMAGLSGVLPASIPHFSLSELGRGMFWKLLLLNVNGNDGTLWTLLIVLVVTLTVKNSLQMEREFKPSWKALASLLAISAYALFSMNKVSEFLYFQF
jgi:hypothetical protein